MIFLICSIFFLGFTFGMKRNGEMSDLEMAAVEDMLNDFNNIDFMKNLIIPAPPLTDMFHRDKRILCKVGDKLYCPGELLFRYRFAKNKF